MKVECPHCRATLNLPTEFGGTVVRCPKCSETFRAETGESGVQAQRLAPLPTSVLTGRGSEPADREMSEGSSMGLWIAGGAVVVIILVVVLGAGLFLFRSVGHDAMMAE